MTAGCCSGSPSRGNFLFSILMLFGVAMSSALAAGVIEALRFGSHRSAYAL